MNGHTPKLKHWLNAVCQNIPEVRGVTTKTTIFQMEIPLNLLELPSYRAANNHTKLPQTASIHQKKALHTTATALLTHAKSKDTDGIRLTIEAVWYIMCREYTVDVIDQWTKESEVDIARFVAQCKYPRTKYKPTHPSRAADGNFSITADDNSTNIHHPILHVDKVTGEISCTINGVTEKTMTRIDLTTCKTFVHKARPKTIAELAITWPPGCTFKTIEDNVDARNQNYEKVATAIHNIHTLYKPATHLATRILKGTSAHKYCPPYDIEVAFARARKGLPIQSPMSPLTEMGAPKSIVYTDAFALYNLQCLQTI